MPWGRAGLDSHLKHVLSQLVTASGGDAQRMADTLQAEMRLDAMRRLRRNPSEAKAWGDAIALVVRDQAKNRGVLTLDQTDDAARAARSLIESIRAQLRDNKVHRRSIASVLAEYKSTLWPQ